MFLLSPTYIDGLPFVYANVQNESPTGKGRDTNIDQST